MQENPQEALLFAAVSKHQSEEGSWLDTGAAEIIPAGEGWLPPGTAEH